MKKNLYIYSFSTAANFLISKNIFFHVLCMYICMYYMNLKYVMSNIFLINIQIKKIGFFLKDCKNCFFPPQNISHSKYFGNKPSKAKCKNKKYTIKIIIKYINI